MIFSFLLRVNIFTTSLSWWYCVHHPMWFSPENTSNIPACVSQTRQLRAWTFAWTLVHILVFTVCKCLRETLVTLGMPLNGREIRTEHGRGATGERGTCWSRWFLCDSHMRATWDKQECSGPWCALSVFICGLVCQGGFEELKGHLISQPDKP